MTIEQKVELKTTKRIEGIIPGLQADLKDSWNSLLWEPEITFNTHKVDASEIKIYKGLVFKTEEFDLNILREPGACTHYYVNENGQIYKANTELWPEDDLMYLRRHAEVDRGWYESLAPKAEEALIDLRKKQIEELMNDPNGRDVIWRPGVDLFGVTYKSAMGGASLMDPLKVWVNKGEIGCPVHGTPLTRSEGWESVYLKCLVASDDPDHFKLFLSGI